MNKSLAIIVASALLVVGAGVAVWWLNQPHSAANQLARAQAAETDLRDRAADLAPEPLADERTSVIREYEKVYEDFEDDGSHDDAKKRIAELYEELVQDKKRAVEVYLLESEPLNARLNISDSARVDFLVHSRTGSFDKADRLV